jgi:transcriptional regulator with XRE-family HTH domain
MEEEGINASQLAEKLGIQRSTLSHILAGRNNPSLDVVYKILDAFPDISAEWLLKGGDEDVYKDEKEADTVEKSLSNKSENPDLFSALDQESSDILNSKETKNPDKPLKNIDSDGIARSEDRTYYGIQKDDDANNIPVDSPSNATLHDKRTDIDRVMTFYTDGTFEVYYRR